MSSRQRDERYAPECAHPTIQSQAFTQRFFRVSSRSGVSHDRSSIKNLTVGAEEMAGSPILPPEYVEKQRSNAIVTQESRELPQNSGNG
ncbi:MAG: hypothetical protein KDB22_03550 [Planctomycetales bacterium]|nr:hypothetical protein [Planctomycetales bacterium]